MKLSTEQKAILAGIVLGDGYLQKTGKKNARLRLEQGANQKEYLFWKVRKFPKLFQGRPRYIERKHPTTGRIYKYWRHQSNSTPELGKWRSIFYRDGKKRIPSNLEFLLREPLGLAVWYMDDGYYYVRDKISYLHLGKVSRDEAEIVKMILEKNFRIFPRVLDKKKKGFAIYFPPRETIRLHEKIGKFILPLFNYKIAMQAHKSS